MAPALRPTPSSSTSVKLATNELPVCTTVYERDGLTDTRVSGVGMGSVTFMPTQSVSVDEQLTSMSKTTCSPGMSACGAAGVAVLEISMSTGCRSAAEAERLPVVGTRRAATTAVATAAWPLPHCHHLPRDFARAVPLPNMSSSRSGRHRRNCPSEWGTASGCLPKHIGGQIGVHAPERGLPCSGVQKGRG